MNPWPYISDCNQRHILTCWPWRGSVLKEKKKEHLPITITNRTVKWQVKFEIGKKWLIYVLLTFNLWYFKKRVKYNFWQYGSSIFLGYVIQFKCFSKQNMDKSVFLIFHLKIQFKVNCQTQYWLSNLCIILSIKQSTFQFKYKPTSFQTWPFGKYLFN